LNWLSLLRRVRFNLPALGFDEYRKLLEPPASIGDGAAVWKNVSELRCRQAMRFRRLPKGKYCALCRP